MSTLSWIELSWNLTAGVSELLVGDVVELIGTLELGPESSAFIFLY